MTLYIIGLGLFQLLCTAAFAIGVYKIIMLLYIKFGKHDTNFTAVSKLKERFVNGEITKEEFEEKMTFLH